MPSATQPSALTDLARLDAARKVIGLLDPTTTVPMPPPVSGPTWEHVVPIAAAQLAVHAAHWHTVAADLVEAFWVAEDDNPDAHLSETVMMLAELHRCVGPDRYLLRLLLRDHPDTSTLTAVAQVRAVVGEVTDPVEAFIGLSCRSEEHLWTYTDVVDALAWCRGIPDGLGLVLRLRWIRQSLRESTDQLHAWHDDLDPDQWMTLVVLLGDGMSPDDAYATARVL